MSLKDEVEFALNFISFLNGSKISTVYSPASILSALAIVYVGAEGETAKQIANIIGKSKSKEEIINYYSEFVKSCISINDEKLTPITSQRSKKRKFDDSKSKVLKISMANRLFIFEKVSLLESYKKLVNEVFNGGIQEMQNLTTDKAVKEINKFVHDSTDGMIKEIVTEDAISNVLLCKFYGKTIQKIDMMEQIVGKDVGWNWRSGQEWKALGIPYQTRKAWLFIILPKKRNGLSTLLKSFDYAVFKDITTRQVLPNEIHAIIPKINITTEIDLKEMLEKSGITNVFSSDKSDLSKMLKGKAYINQGIHKVVIQINEEGTEAAGITSFAVARSARPKPEPEKFEATHPFLYIIASAEDSEDISVKNVFFVGTFC